MMSKSKVITCDAFYKMKAGQTVFLITCDQFDNKKVEAELLKSKPQRPLKRSLSKYTFEGYVWITGWPMLYPNFKLFWTRRAAQQYLDTLSNLNEGARMIVNRVRPNKPI